MNDFTKNMAQALFNQDKINDLLRKELQQAVNDLLEAELTAFLGYDPYARDGWNTGNYLRYNDPHKLSLYLASGIPVIIWKKAAEAKFVEENKVGITVDSLEDYRRYLSH
ncbi:Beta-1,6-galactofuranosyltransferase WbbI [Lactobacillus helveticus]|nr:Beta-1,6-galactofuranosyltransferase WbbI [Lactobacillus helveticus]NRO67304.1 Beta-1,6-galactofuranosyltransferase WbbI [Lactobacillus helveticus]